MNYAYWQRFYIVAWSLSFVCFVDIFQRVHQHAVSSLLLLPRCSSPSTYCKVRNHKCHSLTSSHVITIKLCNRVCRIHIFSVHVSLFLFRRYNFTKKKLGVFWFGLVLIQSNWSVSISLLKEFYYLMLNWFIKH